MIGLCLLPQWVPHQDNILHPDISLSSYRWVNSYSCLFVSKSSILCPEFQLTASTWRDSPRLWIASLGPWSRLSGEFLQSPLDRRNPIHLHPVPRKVLHLSILLAHLCQCHQNSCLHSCRLCHSVGNCCCGCSVTTCPMHYHPG